MPVFTQPPMNTFCWMELCSGNKNESKKFYKAVFGWEADDLKTEGGEYTIFRLNGAMCGSLYQMKEDRKAAGVVPHWNLYAAVQDARAIARRCVELGGKLHGEPMEYEGEVYANVEDNGGARFCLWQPKKQPTEKIVFGEPSAMCWSELYSRDSTKSKSFYTSLLEWKAEPFQGGPMPYTIFSIGDGKQGFGGMIEITAQMQGMPPQWIPYIATSDAHQTARKFAEAGGKIWMGPEAIDNVGTLAMGQDNQGAPIAFIKPNPPAG
ncbi:MAG TPA: VOC family protein [Candidatus Sumerlaeota bacterium]|nr:VOC family protein [Candidatus Sumerlaeota bacterium]HNM45551.1 VOC family protein [Candidatus Sumerlaeota bacterium]